jgi:hypothetical protein
MNSWIEVSVEIVKNPFIDRKDRIIIASVTSYEIVCEMAQSVLIGACLELGAHPDHRIK